MVRNNLNGSSNARWAGSITSLPSAGQETAATTSAPEKTQELRDFIQEISADLEDLQNFYNISLSRTRIERIGRYLSERRNELTLRFEPFDELELDAQVDWILIAKQLIARTKRLQQEWRWRDEVQMLFEGGWVEGLVGLCEARMRIESMDGKEAARVLNDAKKGIEKVVTELGRLKVEKATAYRATNQLGELRERLKEWYGFYEGYDPMFTWWCEKPWEQLSVCLQDFVSLIREKLVGTSPGDEDAIVGQPIGRDAIYDELDTEMIPYSPEELIQIAEMEYVWCETEAKKASREMSFGDDWRKAQEHVKGMYEPPGRQPDMVRELAEEAVAYVEKHDLVTIPRIAKECWKTFMMSPSAQKANPFFLGGTSMIISYPTSSMSHADKLMIMRGNNKPFSRSTVFHELLPGHHLQTHYMPRSKPHRQLFSTPFWMEGWAFYWEMLLWDRGYPSTPENKIGMLFWRMHRCARIVFSLNFHLGKWDPQTCIDYLVSHVGHERATAEGEVRRSFNGDYGALYQAGYMLGALQIYALRREVVDEQRLMGEKVFHDRVMRENCMPIEILRKILKGERTGKGTTAGERLKARWRFYEL